MKNHRQKPFIGHVSYDILMVAILLLPEDESPYVIAIGRWPTS